jgi:voltage-gated potassium channel Kch
MSMSALLSLAAAIALAGSVTPRVYPGIPSARAPQQWGAAVLETLQSSVPLNPIRLEDVAPAATVAARAGNATARALGPATLDATYSTPAQSITPFIQRELNRVWRLTIPAANAPAMRVIATVESIRGETGKLSMVGHDEISIPVLVLDRAPNVHVDNSGRRILEGSVVLQIPSASLQRAGQYAGRLVLRTEGY